MNTSETLYAELKPDVTVLATTLFDLSKKFLEANGNFLPHGAALTEDGAVKLVAAAPENELTNSIEVLPLLHAGLRQETQTQAKAVAVAENVTITPDGGRPTKAIKVLIEHRRGLTVALYLPFKRKLFRGYEYGDSLAVGAAPEINGWGTQHD